MSNQVNVNPKDDAENFISFKEIADSISKKNFSSTSTFGSMAMLRRICLLAGVSNDEFNDALEFARDDYYGDLEVARNEIHKNIEMHKSENEVKSLFEEFKPKDILVMHCLENLYGVGDIGFDSISTDSDTASKIFSILNN